MKVKALFIFAVCGILIGTVSAYVYKVTVKPQPPLTVSYNPYEHGIYASGIIESFQKNGANINIYPEVVGKVTKIFVNEGQNVKQGDLLLTIDDSVQRALVAKDAAEARAALTLLAELKAQPRKENLDIAIAQVEYAIATLKNATDQLDKLQQAYKLNPQSISKNNLDNAINAQKIAQRGLTVAQKQYELTKAGAWVYDIKNQEHQAQAAVQAYRSDRALLEKYTIKAPVAGQVLSIPVAVGGYASLQGVYDAYTNGMLPIITMGIVEPYLAVRCYVDEILIPKLPEPQALEATLLVRGENNYSFPLEFVKIQPYTIPNIELSYEKASRVDVRVLPVIFKFIKPKDINLYLGQLVDVYIKAKKNKNNTGNARHV